MKNILLTICLCVLSLASYAQDGVVKGKILDSSGSPLPGVNIVVKGTTNGTSTDFDGNYELKCTMGNELTISFMGFKSQTITVTSWTLNCTLEENTELLDELIVVGYGVQKKSNMTGSVTNIKSDDLKSVTTPNIANMLQGKAAGVYVSANSGRPGAAPRIRIRGKSTLSGSVNPLWVVDGVIQSQAPELNAQDIETTTVLKDASATALYGSRAANGVVLITTKSAKTDQSRISVSVKTGISQLSLGDFSMMNSAEMTDYIKSFGNGYADLDWFTEEAQAVDTDWFDEGTKLGVVQDYGVSLHRPYR